MSSDERELVETYLKGIGLEYAMPTFDAAGIVTPAALAELEVNFFEALGIESPEDRRKLFYLVQRIKMTVKKGKSEASEDLSVSNRNGLESSPSRPVSQTAVNVVNRTEKQRLPKQRSRTSRSRLILDSDDDLSEDDKIVVTNTESGDSADDELSSVSQNRHSTRRSSLARPRATSSNRSLDGCFTNSDSDTAESVSSRSRRSSGVPLPAAGRRRTQKPASSVSMRTGKQLSSIPAHSVAPMSPLVDIPVKSGLVGRRPEEKEKRRSTKSTQRPGLLDDHLTRSESDQDGTRPSRSCRSVGSALHRTRNHNGGPEGSHRRPSRSPLRATQERSPKRSPKSRVQGRQVDTSFSAQIEKLRESNQEDHDLFGPAATGDDVDSEADDMRIRIVVRKRPMSSAEIAAAGDVDVIHPMDVGSYGKVLLYQPKTKVDLTRSIETIPFAFDNVFDENSTNVAIYERSVRSLIPCLFEGQWLSIFAYGQTNSGKTFTMLGSSFTGIKNNSSSTNPANMGLYHMAALDIFEALRTPGFEHFGVSLSLFEIYGGKLFDLLNGRNHVKCLEDSKGQVCFPGLTEHDLPDADELMMLIQQGASQRSTGTTSRNADSSRSHAVLQLHLRENDSEEEFSRLTFIDLAGSERGADTNRASRATRMEGAEINTSLLALKEVIRAMATGDTLKHIPFRGSKLTQVLKDSFVGENCKSVMIACVSPNIGTVEQTLNTLRYADRVKERNPETGDLGISVKGAKRTTRRSGTDVVTRSLNHRSSFASQGSQNSNLLEELLSSPSKDEDETGRKPSAISPVRVASDEVVSAHKASMATLLDMVKDEMVLVNQADSDRDGLDAYIAKLTDIQEKQLDILSALRAKVGRYRAVKEAMGNDFSSDESFEDLRS